MKRFSLLIIFFIIVLKTSTTLGAEEIFVNSSVEKVEKDEEFDVMINVKDVSVTALQLELDFDDTKLELISEPENSNNIGNTILYVWFDETGGNSPKQNEEIVKFRFRAKGTGKAEFNINGMFFDQNQNEITNADLTGTSVYITEEESNSDTEILDNIESNNSNLKIMRLGIEGITPEFEPNITEYYVVVNQTISNLNIQAIPEHPEALVSITGHTLLKTGQNEVNIEVTSKDQTQTKIYTINVTKTSNVAQTNTNLETLAIEHFQLEPEFKPNITHYKITVPSNTENINILAVPEDYYAQIFLNEPDKLLPGNNVILITVTAKDGKTVKNYSVDVLKTEGTRLNSLHVIQPTSLQPEVTTTPVANKKLGIRNSFSINNTQNYYSSILESLHFALIVIICAL